MKNILAIFLILPLMIAAMAIPNVNADETNDIYIDGPDTAWGLIIGDVVISTTATDIQLVVTVDADWNITEVHCDVADTFDGLHKNKNDNPKVGKFDCTAEYAAGSEPNTVTCLVDKTGFADAVFIAVHVEVQVDESAIDDPAYAKYVVGGIAVPETGWAVDYMSQGIGHYQFNEAGKSWATFLVYELGT